MDDWTGKQPTDRITNRGKVSFWLGDGENRREVKPGETVDLLPGDIKYVVYEPTGET